MLKKKKLGNYPTGSLIMTTTSVLFILGLLALLLLHTKKITNKLKDQIKIFIYLEKDISTRSKNTIYEFLKTQTFVLKKNINNLKVLDIQFISKKEAAEQFGKNTNERFREILDTNPLRDAFVIGINHNFQIKDVLSAIKRRIEKLDGVFEVDYVRDLINIVNYNLIKLKNILIVFSFILFLAVIIIIKNSVKLALYSQRFLIRSMQLVGALPSFIKSPFILRAVFSGFVSGILASILILSLLSFLNYKSSSIAHLQDPPEIFVLMISLNILGICIDTFSTFFSINKYLNMSLDELY